MLPSTEEGRSFSAKTIEALVAQLSAALANNIGDVAFRVALASAVAVLKTLAASAPPSECREELPYASLFYIREADGSLYMTCDHPEPHRTKIGG